MRRGAWIGGLLLLLLLAYMLWPVVGFYRLASALEARDPAALASVVDFQALGKSLTRQFVQAYLNLTGKKREKKNKPKLTLIEKSIAMSVGTSIAEPIVAELIDEKSLLRLLTEGRLAMRGDPAHRAEQPPAATAAADRRIAGDVWQIWLQSEYRGTSVFVRLPPGKPHEEQFRAKLSLSGLNWKLSDLVLPETILARSVKEILAEQEKKQE